MKLSELEAVLRSVCSDTYRYGAPPSAARRLVWAEYGTNDLIGDDVAQLSIPLVQIDVYTQSENDTLAADVITALANSGQYCEVMGIEYDGETMTLRTILQMQLI